VREFWGEILPPAAAAIVMAAIMLPLEFLVVEADTHGALIGLLLIAAQAALGLVIYLAELRIFSRGTLEALREVGARMLRRGRGPEDAAGESGGTGSPAEQVRA
jgi:hypothetical protein